MKSILAAMCVAAAWSATGTTLAAPDGQPPQGCVASQTTQRAYNMGVQLGKTLVDSAWQSVNDCSKLDQFSEVLKSDINSYVLRGTSSYTICRYSGLVDGAYEELHAVSSICGGPCCWEGQMIGVLGAAAYCTLSAVFGGLSVPGDFVPRPVYTCSGFSACCIETFTIATVADCKLYTDPPFADVWTNSRTLQCTD